MNVGEAGHYYRFTRYRSPDWMVDAACRGMDTEKWFVFGGPAAQPAIKICARCPVARQCLQFALRCESGADKRYGIFGGLGPEHRAELARRKTRA
jgi:WhiB family transcriptional regulator, redox-sensing transcriptional regulator